LFETNVGGLPIIDTKNLVASGDQGTKYKQFYGSLNFIFNNFDENNSFEKWLKKQVFRDLRSLTQNRFERNRCCQKDIDLN
jgi:hypothetical protein